MNVLALLVPRTKELCASKEGESPSPQPWRSSDKGDHQLFEAVHYAILISTDITSSYCPRTTKLACF